MSLATHKQTTAHPSSHDEGGVCEDSGDRYPPDLRIVRDYLMSTCLTIMTQSQMRPVWFRVAQD